MKLQGQKSTSKKLYLGNELLGIEKRISPTLVGEKRASHMKNFLLVDGINRKRNGWRQIYHFRDENDNNLKINGIYEYKEKEIIHAGEYLFNGDKKIGTLANTKSCGFENNGLLYIVCGGELYIYNGTELINAYDSIYSYVPLTTKNISPIGYESTSAQNEDTSLLTPKRINTLIGDKGERKKYKLDGKLDINKPIEIKTKMLIKLDSEESNIAPYNAIYKDATRLLENNIEGVLGVDASVIYDIFSGEGTIYNLGAIEEVAVFLNMPIKIESVTLEARDGFNIPRMSFHLGSDIVYDTEKVTEGSVCDFTDTLFGQTIDAIYFYGNADDAIINNVNIQGRASYEGEIEITHSVDKINYNENIKPTSIKDTGGRELTLSRNITGSQGQTASVWLEESISPNETVLGFSFCNVSQTLNESNIEITYSVIGADAIKCDIGDVCKIDTGSAILALSSENTIYLSCGVQGFGYFPSNLKRKIGIDGKITALCAMSDYSLGVFKESDAYYFVPKITENKTELELKCFSNQGGSLSHFATKTVNLDTLSPQKDNIYGSIGTDGRVRRGSNIAHDFKKLSLENSLALEHNGCYYLFVDGRVYVADTRYKHYESNRLDSSFEYEWWCLENIPASYVAKINNLIYIGREDGRIVSFYEGYSDIYYEKIDTGSFLLSENEAGNTVLYLNEELNLLTCDKILVRNAYSYLGDIVSQGVSDGKIKLVLSPSDFWSSASPVGIYPNVVIYLQCENGELVETTVDSVDALEYSLTLDLSENSDTYTGILLKNDNTSYTLEQEDDHFLLLDIYGDPARLCYTDNILLECERKAPVECEYVSPALLNDSHTNKALYGITIELLGDSQGSCELSYETNNSLCKKSYELGSIFDFDKLDFSTITFNSSLQKSYTLRCFERSLDYIIIKIKHSEDKPFSLKCYLLTYKENN